ncbi:MAG: hypothetical protein PHI96_03785 [Desulfovibrio sp.]|nr:hypothetical protein [Desulfovibrio sp.]
MKNSKLASTSAALALVALLGTAGVASAQNETPMGPRGGQMGQHMGPHMNMTTEQMNAMQDIHKEFGPKMQPLYQQKYGKQAEINALLYQGVKADDPKILALQKDVKDVDNKLYQLDSAMRKQMQDKGVPFMGAHGMGRGMMGGMDCPGMGGRGMMGGKGHGGHGGYGMQGTPGMHGAPGMHGGGYNMMDQNTSAPTDAKKN